MQESFPTHSDRIDAVAGLVCIGIWRSDTCVRLRCPYFNLLPCLALICLALAPACQRSANLLLAADRLFNVRAVMLVWMMAALETDLGTNYILVQWH